MYEFSLSDTITGSNRKAEMKERMNGGDLVANCATDAAHMQLVTPTKKNAT
jgi:hypothetical protein